MDAAVIEKFWAGVVKGEKPWECWGWTGTLDKTGLPTIRLGNSRTNRQEYYPRRISLELTGITLLPKKKVVSTCRNKLCLNPQHLAHGDEARFWKHVQKLRETNGCWIWVGPESHGYGEITIDRKVIRASRYSWELYTGRPIPDGLFVCHTCDNTHCVNPHHLFLGTHKDNQEDKMQKGRQARGETHRAAVLTEEKVKLIRELRNSGMTLRQLSQQFGVCFQTISDITLYKSWKHVA